MLILLQHQIQILDQHHWERQSEISHDKRTTTSTALTRSDNSKSSTSTTSSNNNKAAATTLQSSTQKMSSSSSSYTSSPSTKAKNPHANKLGKNGKLTSEEWDRHFKLQLCLFCSLAGHKVTDCPSTKNSTKGKASSTVPANAKLAKE